MSCFIFYALIGCRLTLVRANKLRAEVHLPNLEADDTWLLYFESAFNKAAKVCSCSCPCHHVK